MCTVSIRPSDFKLGFIVCTLGHCWDQDEINKLTNKQETTGKEPEESGDPFAVVEAVNATESYEAQTPDEI